MNKIMPQSLSGKAKANQGNTKKKKKNHSTGGQRGCRKNSIFKAVL